MAITPDTPSFTNVPTPQSYEQILSDALSAYAAKIGIDDFNVGSAVTSFFEVVALTTARASGDLFQILRDFSVDRATGDALQRLATENNITPITASPATGFVSVIDTSFTKIATSVYAGLPAPNVGSTLIAVGDASKFPATGAIYIGRGTPNIEGPLAYNLVGVSVAGNTTINSQIITGLLSTANLLVGYPVTGTMIPAGATIQSIDSSTQITLTLAATATAIGASLTYTTPPVLVGSYWTVTLAVPTAKFHNLGETVIVAQGGNRSVPINSTVIAPALGANPSISYNTTASAIVLDGETTVNNVPVTAQLPGSDGNVPIGAIKQFASAPFSGATVSNPLAFTTGQDNETDDQLRVSIKNALASIGLGTVFAVESAVQGAQCTTPVAATVSSTDMLEASYGAVLYLDNGSGYEETSTGVGVESILNSALGGEQFFQLACGGNQSSVAKAFLQSSLGTPFAIRGGDTLAIVVGGITYQHTFQNSDFRSPNAATAYEITASINGDTTLGFEALTQGGGTYVVLRDKTEGKDSIQITTPITTGRDASIQMGFPSSLYETLRLYKNNMPLSKDGATASILTQDQSLWSASIANGDTLVLSVDGTSPITYTITNAMFIAAGDFTSVANTNSLASWVKVFNNVLTGVTAAIVGSQIQLTSNLGTSNRAEIVIGSGSTLVTKGMFSSSLGLVSQGAASDYTLNRNTAQIELTAPLVAKDSLAAGTTQTAARIQSVQIAAGSVVLTAEGYIWLLIDDPGVIIPTGVVGNTALTVSSPSTNVIRYTSNVVGAFSNVQTGDYVIVWSTDIPLSDRFEGRVYAVTSTTLDISVTATEFAAYTPVTGIPFTQGFVVCRCSEAPQKFSIPLGTSTIDAVAEALQAQSDEVKFTTLLEQYLVITSNTLDISGSLMVVTADANGQALDFTTGVMATSNPSLLAAYDSGEYDAQMPLFLHSPMAAPGVIAYPPDSFLTQFTSATSLAGTDPNNLISVLHPYGIIRDAQPYGDFVQETSLSTNPIVDIAEKATMRRLRGDTPGQLDRYFLASPLDFGPKDTAVVIIDNNPVSGSFTIPFFRVATTNTVVSSNTNTFNATDTAAGGAAFSSTFGSTFDFSNFKVLMQAKNVMQPTPPNTAILYRSAPWGRTGERMRISYAYPSSSNQGIGNVVTNDENIHISIVLASGLPIATGITSTTKWNVLVTPNTPAGIDQVTYTWAGQYTFTVPPANVTIGAVYSTPNGQTFTAAATIVSTFASFTGVITGTSTSVTLTANNLGTNGNSIVLTGNGVSTITTLIANWNAANPSNQVSLTSGSGSQVPAIGTTSLAGGLSGTPLVTNGNFSAPNTAPSVLTKISGTGDATINYSAFSFVGSGTNPALTLVGGEYVNIGVNSGFSSANTGVFKVSTAAGFTPTSIKFSVQMPNGVASAASPVLTGVTGSVLFYNAAPTTANAVVAYVNANLSQYLTASLANYGVSNDGTGVINFSTSEDSAFATSYIQLKDGINWIASSNLGGSPEFSLKNPLALPTAYGYAFNNSEKIELSPTTMEQVDRFLNVLAVTGFTTLGNVDLVDRGTRVQLSTQTLGSVGAIQIVGGLANSYEVPIFGSAQRIDNVIMSANATLVAAAGVQSGQWFRLQAGNKQAKATGFSSNTSATIVGNSPIAGESIITLLNRNSNQRYFGTPRYNVRPQGRTFRIEKQGSLVCLSANPNISTSPMFQTAVNFNDVGGGGSVNLGTAANFAVLAYSAITGSAASGTVVNGDMGIYPNTLSSVTNFPPGIDNGTIHAADAAANQGRIDGNTAFLACQTAGLAGTTILSELGGQILTPGAYKFASGSAGLSLTSGNSTLTFNGAGTYIIYTASTLLVGASGSTDFPVMAFTGGATPTNTFIYWAVGSSATINQSVASAGATFYGTVLAFTSVAVTQASTIDGRLLAVGGGNGAVTLTGVTTVNAPAGAGTVNVTPVTGSSNTQYTVASGPLNFNGLSIGDLVTIVGLNASNSGTFLVTGISSNGQVLQVLNPNGVVQSGAAVVSGTTFTSTTQVSEGDTMIVSAPFNVLNQGQFRIIRRYNDSVWFENPNVVEEEVSLPLNPVSLGFDATTSFAVSSSNGSLLLTWNGTGTEPFLGNVNMGDIITFGTDFNIANQGSFMVLQSGVKLQEIASFIMPTASSLPSAGAGAYFDINSAGNANLYRVWFNVTPGTNVAPSAGGRTLVQVNVNAGDSAATVANDTAAVISALNTSLDFFTATSSGTLTVTTQGFKATTAPLAGTMPSPFAINVLQAGRVTFLEVVNPSAFTQSSVTVSTSTLVVDRPQLVFYEYDATVPGDNVVITNNAFNINNIGSWPVIKVLSQDSAIVRGSLVSVSNVSLNGIVSSLYVEEGVAYSGYKNILYAIPQPGAPTFTTMAFTTNAQYDKINQAALVQMLSLNKMNYSTVIKFGLDSYQYNTGLIQVANEIVYGNPRDNITFPGVAAAGAEIFIRGPLIRRIQVSLAIRLNTGVPFAQTVQTVQNTVTALVNSNKLGQPLAISSIISAVTAIPGILSVAVSFPKFDVNDDLIVLTTGEKALIIDPTTDVSVSQIGT